MNCQYCGKKIGILENWRYGRFCSKEHQDEFREEASRLAASVLGGRIGSSGDAPAQVAEALSLTSKPPKNAAGEPVEPPDPPRMEPVTQDQPAPVKWKAWKADPAPPPPSERDQKSLRILASIDRPAPPVLEKDSRRKLVIEDSPYRFGQVTAKGTRSVLVPPSGAVQRRPKLLFHDALFPLDFQETNAASAAFECIWQGDAAWSPEDDGNVALDYGDFPGVYAPEAPWAEWDWDGLLEEAQYTQAITEEREKRRNALRAQKSEQRTPSRPVSEPRMPEFPARTAPSGHTPHYSTPQPVGGLRQALPELNLVPAGSHPHQAGPALRVPLQGGLGRPSAGVVPSHSGGTSGVALPAMPSYPGRMVLRPVVPGSAARPDALSHQGQYAGYGGSAATGDSTPMEWVELAPPLFLALCKIDDPEPLAAQSLRRTPVSAHLTPESEALFTSNGAVTWATTAGMPGIFADQLTIQFPAPMRPTDPERKSAAVEPFPAAPVCEIPVRPQAQRLFALPARPAGARVALMLRPVPMMERALPACRLAG
jgi:hypothetical protein